MTIPGIMLTTIVFLTLPYTGVSYGKAFCEMLCSDLSIICGRPIDFKDLDIEVPAQAVADMDPATGKGATTFDLSVDLSPQEITALADAVKDKQKSVGFSNDADISLWSRVDMSTGIVPYNDIQILSQIGIKDKITSYLENLASSVARTVPTDEAEDLIFGSTVLHVFDGKDAKGWEDMEVHPDGDVFAAVTGFFLPTVDLEERVRLGTFYNTSSTVTKENFRDHAETKEAPIRKTLLFNGLDRRGRYTQPQQPSPQAVQPILHVTAPQTEGVIRGVLVTRFRYRR